MAKLGRFIHDRKSALPPVVKAALARVRFEAIFILSWTATAVWAVCLSCMLQDVGILSRPLLYPDLYGKQNREDCYRLPSRVRRHGDRESWVDFFRKGVEPVSASAVETARNPVRLFGDDAASAKGRGRSSGSALMVFEVLGRQPLISLKGLCERTGFICPTVSRDIGGLGELGIVRELTRRRRSRVFVYDSYLSILGEGTGSL